MRKTYERDFKTKVCKDIANKTSTVGGLAKEYQISRPIISRWVSEYNRYGKDAFTGKGIRLPDQSKIYAITEENKRLREENEILKKFETFVKHAKI